jgi:hydroxymethylpyrimidine pyrophosphatase-like HAD family hydrolase
MRVKGLALDYDGTLASADRIAPDTLRALEQARSAGVRLILATGRVFFELTRVCERLDLFEAVVAENGAVLYVPSAGTIADLAPPLPTRLFAELDRRGIPYQAGRVIVGTFRAWEDRVRDAMASVGVSLDRVYNREALMLLPAGISKGTGIQQVLGRLGLSFHDVLAIGDSENDVELFRACGWRACPGNAVRELTAQADWVFPGGNGASVALAIRDTILTGRLDGAASPRHQVELGWAVGTTEPVSIPGRDVNVLIHGDPLSGKSWLAGALVERLLDRRYAVCVIDPEGDYRVLGRLPSVTWTAVRDRESVALALARFDQDPAAGVVLDFAPLPHGDKLPLIAAALELIRARRARQGVPHWVVLDEAHYLVHRQGVSDQVLASEDKGLCLVTYRTSWLRESALGALDVLILARTTDEAELDFLRMRLAGLPDTTRMSVSALGDLLPGEFVLVTRPGTGAISFIAAPRATPHVRHLRKYADSTVPCGASFVFRDRAGHGVATADSLASFRDRLWAIDDGILAHHAGRGDFSRWVHDVFSDQLLAAQLRKTERRWSRGEISDLRGAIADLIARRYAVEP